MQGQVRHVKKGQAQMSMLHKGALAVLMIVVLLAVGAQVLGELRDTQLEANRVAVTNESVTPTCVANESDTCSGMANTSLANGRVLSSSFGLTNADNVAINSSDYVLYNEQGQFELTNFTLNNTVLNATYNFDTDEETLAYNISGTGAGALQDFGDFMPVIVIVIIAVAIIVLLLEGLRRSRSR